MKSSLQLAVDLLHTAHGFAADFPACRQHVSLLSPAQPGIEATAAVPKLLLTPKSLGASSRVALFSIHFKPIDPLLPSPPDAEIWLLSRFLCPCLHSVTPNTSSSCTFCEAVATLLPEGESAVHHMALPVYPGGRTEIRHQLSLRTLHCAPWRRVCRR